MSMKDLEYFVDFKYFVDHCPLLCFRTLPLVTFVNRLYSKYVT